MPVDTDDKEQTDAVWIRTAAKATPEALAAKINPRKIIPVILAVAAGAACVIWAQIPYPFAVLIAVCVWAALAVAGYFLKARKQARIRRDRANGIAREDDDFEPLPSAGSARRKRAVIVTAASVLFIAAPWTGLAIVAMQSADLQTIANDLEAKARTTNTERPILPLSKAQQCVSLSLSAGNSKDGLASLNATCGTEMATSMVPNQVLNNVRADSVVALEAPYSYPTGQRGVYSILVSAQLYTWTSPGATDPTPDNREDNWRDRGWHCYRTPIYVDPATGKQALITLPREVQCPVATAPESGVTPGKPDLTDPRTALVRDYAERYYLPVDPADPQAGSIANLTAPGSANLTLHDPNITGVELVGITFAEPDESGLVATWGQIAVRYGDGNAVNQVLPLTLVQASNRWLVTDITPTFQTK